MRLQQVMSTTDLLCQNKKNAQGEIGKGFNRSEFQAKVSRSETFA